MRISYVIPCYCSAITIGSVVNEIEMKMIEMDNENYEIILVNDSSPDDTFDAISQICEEDFRIIGIDLAKNFGQHAAIMAGLHYATGEVIVCLDDDGQTPANQVDRLLEKIELGYDVVYAKYDNKKHSWSRNLGSKLNKKMTEYMLGKPKDLYVSSYFAMRRFVMEEILRYQYSYPYLIGLVLRTTKKICNVNVDHKTRTIGKSGYTFSKLVQLWINGFTAFSVKPLRIASLCGAGTACIGFFYAIWTIIKKFINPAVPIGWSSLTAIVLIIGGAILLVLGLIGEYIGRIYISINNAPQYVIREVINER